MGRRAERAPVEDERQRVGGEPVASPEHQPARSLRIDHPEPGDRLPGPPEERRRPLPRITPQQPRHPPPGAQAPPEDIQKGRPDDLGGSVDRPSALVDEAEGFLGRASTGSGRACSDQECEPTIREKQVQGEDAAGHAPTLDAVRFAQLRGQQTVTGGAPRMKAKNPVHRDAEGTHNKWGDRAV